MEPWSHCRAATPPWPPSRRACWFPRLAHRARSSASIKPGVSGTVTISATYNGVTRSAVLTISAQSLLRIITESPLPNARVGENYAGFIEACCGQGTPYTWSLVSGSVPSGLRFAGNDLQLSRTTAVTGVATSVQTSTFTVRVRDGAGNTATKTFTLTVDPANPLIINNGTDVLTSGRVGVAYNNGLFPLGGTPPWTWSHIAGTLPPGLSVQASPGARYRHADDRRNVHVHRQGQRQWRPVRDRSVHHHHRSLNDLVRLNTSPTELRRPTGTFTSLPNRRTHRTCCQMPLSRPGAAPTRTSLRDHRCSTLAPPTPAPTVPCQVLHMDTRVAQETLSDVCELDDADTRITGGWCRFRIGGSVRQAC